MTSATLMDVKKTLGTLTTALVAITTQIDHLSQGKASQVAIISAQPGTRAGENPTAASSASINLTMEEQVRLRVEHRARSAHTPAWPSLIMKWTWRRRKGSQPPG